MSRARKALAFMALATTACDSATNAEPGPRAASIDGAALDASGSDGTTSGEALDASTSVDGATVDAGDGAALSPTCAPGLPCNGKAFCGYSDGREAAACACDATGHFACGAPAPVRACASGAPPPCTKAFYDAPEVLCATTTGTTCSMEACQSNATGGVMGWGGPCERRPAQCPPAGSSWCGDSCIPAATGCTCATSAVDPTPKACSCLEVPPQIDPLGGRLFCR